MIAPPPLLAAQRSPGIISLLYSVSRIASTIVITVGCLGLLGWVLDIAILKSVVPGLASMKANTALAFLLAGIALAGVQQSHGDRRWWWVARACAATVALLGFLTLIEYIFGRDLLIDQLLFTDRASSALPGRMASATALCFCLLGLALLLLKAQRGYWAASAMIFATLLITWIAIIGYIYGVASLYAIDMFSTIAIHTAITLLILGIGTLLTQPERGLLGMATSTTAGGLMARRMLPAAMIIPFILGWLRWQGQLLGLYDTAFGLSLLVILLTIVFAAFIWWNARSLHQLDLDRMRSEAILRESQERLGGIIGSVMDALISIDSAQRILIFNAAAEQMFGCSAAAALGQPIDQFIPTRFRGMHSTHIRAFGQTDVTSRSMHSPDTLTGIRADGSEFSIEATISQTAVAGQKLYTAIIRDITGRKQAEAALQQSGARFAKTFQFSPAAMGIAKQSNGQMIDVNESYQRLLGYRADEVRGHNVSALNLYVDYEQRTQMMELMRAHGSFDRYELTLRTKSGDIRAVLASAEIIDLDNEPCILSAFVDITERKQSEQALQHNQALLRRIVDTNPNIIFVKDRAANIILANRALADSYQMSLAELEGHSQAEAHTQAGMSQAELQQWLADDQEVIDTGRTKAVLEVYTHRNGSLHWNATNKFPLDLADGSQGVLTISEDITERRQAEVRLRQQAELLEQTYDAVIVWEWGGPITYWNRAAEELYGFSREEAVGQTTHGLLKTVHPVDTQGFEALLERHGHWEGELQHTTKAGVDLVVESRHVCFRGTSGNEESCRLVLETNHDITERRATERALRQSEDRFGRAFHASPAALAITRASNGHIIDVNATFLHLHGYRREEVIDHSAQTLHIFPDPDEFAAIGRLLREEGAVHNREIIIQSKSGELRSVIFSIGAIEIDREACFLITLVDISHRKQAEEQLQHQADLLAQASDAFISTDTSFTIKSWNAAAEALYGWPAQEVIGKPMHEIIPTEYVDSDIQQVLALFLREGRWRGEVTQSHRDGTQLSILSSVSVLKDTAGKPVGAVAVNRDITDRKRAAQALERAAERLRVLADASRAFAEVGTEYQALLDDVARKTTEVLSDGGVIRLVSEDALWLDLGALYDVDTEKLEMARIVLGGTPLPVHELSLTAQIFQSQQPLLIPVIDQEQMRAATKPMYWSLVNRLGLHSMIVVPMRVQGQAIGVLIVYRHQPEQSPFNEDDLTLAQDLADRAALAINNARLLTQVQHELAERIKAEAALRTLSGELEDRVVARTAELHAANQELEAFSYSVSHDLRAPLRAIDGFSRILLEDYLADLPEDAQRYLQLVRDSTQQMGRLVDDLLAFARLSRQPINKREVAMGELVRQCLDELHAEQSGRQIDIQIGDLPAVAGDPALLKQVWINLLANALKYTRRRDPAVITIGYQTQGNQLIYVVKDNGVGFDMRYINKLFGVFQRMHRAEDYEGTGVGLAIVQRIIHRHGGRVWAEAVVDSGATFYFTLGGEVHE
ncbi:MAG: PAS domain S-box protein [Roseiflexaceae bacterium]